MATELAVPTVFLGVACARLCSTAGLAAATPGDVRRGRREGLAECLTNRSARPTSERSRHRTQMTNGRSRPALLIQGESIVLSFGKSIERLALTAMEARQLGAALLIKAQQMDGKTATVALLEAVLRSGWGRGLPRYQTARPERGGLPDGD